MGVRGMRLPAGARIVSMVATAELAEAADIVSIAASEDDDNTAETSEEVDVTDTAIEQIEADDDDVIVSSAVEESQILTACANGYGKRTPVSKYPLRKRGGQGVIAVQTSERNGELVSAVIVNKTNELLLISDMGTLVRTRIGEVSVQGRNSQGVTLIRLSDDEQLVGIVCLDVPEEDVLDVDGEAVVEVSTADTELVNEDAPAENENIAVANDE
jgi:DNA gyrase subunit A